MIRTQDLAGQFVEALPSLRLDRPSLAAELSEWRICVAKHFIQLKKSGPASESRIAYLLLERLFVDGDEEVREEARLLVEAIVTESIDASLDEKTISKDFGPETIHALTPDEKPVASIESPGAMVWLPPFWGWASLLFGFTAWIPMLVLSIFRIHGICINVAAWVLAAIGLGCGIRFGYRKKL